MKMYRKWLCMLLALVLAAGLASCAREEPVQTAAPAETAQATDGAEATEEASTQAPDFTVYDREGKPHRLSDFAGKPVILNFWATWCGPCKNEMPQIQKAYEAYGDEIEFVMVDLADGTSETVEQAAEYVAQQGYTFPVYFDTQMEGAATYGVSSIPITYFIDSDGYLVAYYLGSMDESILQQGIAMLLGT